MGEYVLLSAYSLYSKYRDINMNDHAHQASRTFEQLLSSLRDLPGVQVDLEHANSNHARDAYDFQLNLVVEGKTITVLVDLKKSVFPRDARQTLWKFADWSHAWANTHDVQAQPMLVADTISAGAKDILRSERWGYFDSGGSLYLPAPGAFLYIDKPPPKSAARAVRSLFTGRRAQVLHALLVNHNDWFGVTNLANKAQVSASTAAQVLAELDRHEWTEARGLGPAKERHLQDPSALLDAWALEMRAAPAPTLKRYFVPGIKSNMLAEKASQTFTEYNVMHAVTHEAAAQRFAPFLSSVSQVRCRIQANEAAKGALQALDAREVSEGANLAIIEAKDQGDLLFRDERQGIWLASPVQVYLDLVRSEGRAKEAAEHLRKETIGF